MANADQAKAKAMSPIGIILIVATVLCLIGAILVWANDYKIGKSFHWLTAFYIAIVILNLCVYFLTNPAVAPVAWAIFLVSCDSYFTFARACDVANLGLGLAGTILVLIGTITTFCSFPGNFQMPHFGKSDVTRILIIVVTILLIIGNLLVWIGRGDAAEKIRKATKIKPPVAIVVHPLFLALIYLVGNMWEWAPAVDLSFFAAGFLIVFDWCNNMVLSRETELAGWILINAALAILIILHVYKISRATRVIPVSTV